MKAYLIRFTETGKEISRKVLKADLVVDENSPLIEIELSDEKGGAVHVMRSIIIPLPDFRSDDTNG